MADGYQHIPEGRAALPAELRALRNEVRAMRRAFSAHTVRPLAVENAAYNLSNVTATAPSDIVTSTVTVPDGGFTTALIQMHVDFAGLRDTTTNGVNTLTIQAFADGVGLATQDSLTLYFPTAEYRGYVAQSFGLTLDALDEGGGTFTIGAIGCGSATGWQADTGSAHLTATILFTR